MSVSFLMLLYIYIYCVWISKSILVNNSILMCHIEFLVSYSPFLYIIPQRIVVFARLLNAIFTWLVDKIDFQC